MKRTAKERVRKTRKVSFVTLPTELFRWLTEPEPCRRCGYIEKKANAAKRLESRK